MGSICLARQPESVASPLRASSAIFLGRMTGMPVSIPHTSGAWGASAENPIDAGSPVLYHRGRIFSPAFDGVSLDLSAMLSRAKLYQAFHLFSPAAVVFFRDEETGFLLTRRTSAEFSLVGTR